MRVPKLLLPVACLLVLECLPAVALRTPTRASHDPVGSEDDGRCDDTVSFLFLARDDLPLDKVWRKFLDGCVPGSYTVHVHSQGSGAAPALPEVQHVADPVQGELRRNYSMQLAMHRLYRDASAAVAPNGCRPRWAQMLSDSCAPLRGCADLQAILRAHAGSSLMESWLCTVGAKADACYCRKPGFWHTPWYKAHQWSTLWMDHARMLLDREQDNYHNWHGNALPDEHYTINILDSLGANHTAFGLTHVYPFLPGHKGHPEAIDCSPGAVLAKRWHDRVAFASSVQDVLSAGRIFARKYGPSCAESLLENLPAAAAPR